MSEHAPRTVERHCDVAIIGGSAAGLAAALQLARQRRSVIVIDAAEPRNAPAAPMAASREEVRNHGGEVLTGLVTAVTRTDDRRFRLEVPGGHAIVARRVLGANGVVDDLPAMALSLADEDLDDAVGAAAEGDWDARYSGETLMWSGNPNGTLVHEVSDLPAGRVLDVGAGEGGDAVWLAERGWVVTATDISARALARVAAAASQRGVSVTCLHRDANAPEGFGGVFDLVSLQYGAIPRTPEQRGLHNLLDAVAPGGTLLVVGHDLTPMRTPVDPAVQTRMFDPDSYIGVEDFARALAGRTDWTIECHETRPRPAGAASAHHVDDVVLRARYHPRP